MEEKRHQTRAKEPALVETSQIFFRYWKPGAVIVVLAAVVFKFATSGTGWLWTKSEKKPSVLEGTSLQSPAPVTPLARITRVVEVPANGCVRAPADYGEYFWNSTRLVQARVSNGSTAEFGPKKHLPRGNTGLGSFFWVEFCGKGEDARVQMGVVP